RPRPGDLVAGDVDGEVADVQVFRGGHLEAAYPRADAGDQLLGLERLGDVVVGPGLEAADHVDGVAAGRQHHDGDAGLGPDLPADVDAVLAGQHQVEQDHVGPEGPERAHRLVTAGDDLADADLAEQHTGEHIRRGRVTGAR